MRSGGIVIQRLSRVRNSKSTALLAIRSRRAIVAAAAKMAVSCRARRCRCRGRAGPKAARSSTRRRELRLGVLSACQLLLLAAERSKRSDAFRPRAEGLARARVPPYFANRKLRTPREGPLRRGLRRRSGRFASTLPSHPTSKMRANCARRVLRRRRSALQESVTRRPAVSQARLIRQWNPQAANSSSRIGAIADASPLTEP